MTKSLKELLTQIVNAIKTLQINKVNGMQNVVIRDSSHVQTISAYSYADVTYNLLSLGAPKGNTFVGYSVLCDSNTRLILSFVSASSDDIVVRFYNPTNTAQTMHGVIAILKYLT